MIVGIDYGSTNSRVAVWTREGNAVLVPSDDFHPSTPSLAFRTGSGEYLVGRRAALSGSWGISKRLLGQHADAGARVSAEDTATLVISHLIKQVENQFRESDLSAVLCVPAGAGVTGVQALIDAAKTAGLTVASTLSYPIASAMAFCGNQDRDRLRMLTYDFGGGKFEAALVEKRGREFKLVSWGGDDRLGGYDLDHMLASRMVEEWRFEGYDLDADSKALATLARTAEGAKVELSSVERTDVALGEVRDRFGKPRLLDASISRSEFEGLIGPTVDRTFHIVQEVIRDAGSSLDELDVVLFTGGSSRIPLVRRRAAELLGGEGIFASLDPDQMAVAAAVVGGRYVAVEQESHLIADSDFKTGSKGHPAGRSQVGPLSGQDLFGETLLGQPISFELQDGKRSILFPRGIALPATVTQSFVRLATGEVSLNLFEGESRLGSFRVPPGDHAAGDEVRLSIRVNTDRTIEIALGPAGGFEMSELQTSGSRKTVSEAVVLGVHSEAEPPLLTGPGYVEEARNLVVDENVQYSVYRPEVVEPLKWFSLLAFAHLAGRRPDAPEDEPDPVDQVLSQARRVLGESFEDYIPLVQDSSAAIPRSSTMTFLPEVSGLEFNPPRASFLWLESMHWHEFRFRASSELDGKTARGRLAVFLGPRIVADVPLSIRVDSNTKLAGRALAHEMETARPYRKVFASYSHSDVAIVEELERAVQSLGDRYLRDATTLRSGEMWSDRLAQLIQDADIFQLFWSWSSMRSSFVRQEWEHALALNRPHFVRPVYWEEPLPEDKSKGLPPDALTKLHFQRLDLTVRTKPPKEPKRSPVASRPIDLAEIDLDIPTFLRGQRAASYAEPEVSDSASSRPDASPCEIEGSENFGGLFNVHFLASTLFWSGLVAVLAASGYVLRISALLLRGGELTPLAHPVLVALSRVALAGSIATAIGCTFLFGRKLSSIGVLFSIGVGLYLCPLLLVRGSSQGTVLSSDIGHALLNIRAAGAILASIPATILVWKLVFFGRSKTMSA